jgi:hypothetical protein
VLHLPLRAARVAGRPPGSYTAAVVVAGVYARGDGAPCYHLAPPGGEGVLIEADTLASSWDRSRRAIDPTRSWHDAAAPTSHPPRPAQALGGAWCPPWSTLGRHDGRSREECVPATAHFTPPDRAALWASLALAKEASRRAVRSERAPGGLLGGPRLPTPLDARSRAVQRRCRG